MTRRTITPRQALAIAVNQGAVVPCYRCRIAFTAETVKHIEREHLHEIELGGPDELDNMAWSHKECHGKITNGSKATTAGSSKHRIAKQKRIAKGGKKRKGPPIKSREFQKPPPNYNAWKKQIERLDND